jgi:hypothetical protein
MIAIFAVAMLMVTTLKIRILSCTWIFIQLYAPLYIAQSYLYFSQQIYQKMLPVIVKVKVEMMRNFSVIQKSNSHLGAVCGEQGERFH